MDILSFPKSRSIKLTSKNEPRSFSRSNTAEFGSLVWKFDPDNHYLHPKWLHVVYSKRMLLLLVISIIPLFFLDNAPRSLAWGYFDSATVLIWIPYLFLIILSFNRDARTFILKSSEFWIKIAYSIACPILLFILLFIHFHFVERLELTGNTAVYLAYIGCCLNFATSPLLMIVVGGMDAIPKLKYKWKAMLMAMVALYFTIDAITYQLVVPRDDDYIVVIEATGSEVSVVSLLSNVYGMIAIFLWKQAVDVIRNKDRCTSITYRPYLQWVKPGSGAPLIDAEQLQNTDSVADEDSNTDVTIVGL